MNKINVICGMGEIGKPLLKLISKSEYVVGYDINPKLSNNKKMQDLNLNPHFFMFVYLLIKNFNLMFLPWLRNFD